MPLLQVEFMAVSTLNDKYEFTSTVVDSWGALETFRDPVTQDHSIVLCS